MARTAAGLTSKSAAEQIGVTPQALSSWERVGAGHSPSEWNLQAMAALYAVPAEWIRYGTSEEEATEKQSSEATSVDSGERTATRRRKQTQTSAMLIGLAGDRAEARAVTYRYWLAVTNCFKAMHEALRSFDDGENEHASLVAHRALLYRFQMLNSLAHTVYLNTAASEERLAELQDAALLNMVTFERLLEPDETRQRLSRRNPLDWAEQLGVKPFNEKWSFVLSPQLFFIVDEYRNKLCVLEPALLERLPLEN